MRNILLILLAIVNFTFAGLSQTVIKMKTESGVSIIPCKVNGLKLNFIFDTGAGDVSISLTEASFMLKNGYLEENDILGTSKYTDANGDISEGVVINLREIEIGGLKLNNVKASIVKNIKAPLLLGQSAISKLGVVQLDLKSNTLTILADKMSESSPDVNASISADSTVKLNIETKKLQGLIELGRAKAKGGDYAGSIEYFDLAIQQEPDDINAHLFRGISNVKLKNYETAITDYNRAIKIDPTSAKAYTLRGIAKTYIKDFNGAMQDYNQSIALNPENASALFNRADLKDTLKDYRGAIADYNLTSGD